MFFGEYNHTLDAKNRLMMPARMRKDLGEEAYIVKSVDKCLSLYPAATWEALWDKLSQMPGTEVRDIKQYLYSATKEAPIDSQGRILVDPKHILYAGIGKEVTIIGAGDHIEIWEPTRWEARVDGFDGDVMAQRMIELGF